MGETTVPFLRWPGGKRWLAPSLAPALARVLAASGGTYFEPFLGAGAVALALAPERAVLSEANRDLVRCFRFVRDWPDRLLDIVAGWPVDEPTYYRIRAEHSATGIEAAARFVYLNRTCYGGLHRTNKAGRFTAAWGGGSRTTEPLFRERLVARAAVTLDRPDVHLLARDWRGAFRDAVAGDAIYCDPPSTTKTPENSRSVFSFRDREELAQLTRRAKSQGVTVIVSSSAWPETADLRFDAITIGKQKHHGTLSNPDNSVVVLAPKGKSEVWLELLAGKPYPSLSMAA